MTAAVPEAARRELRRLAARVQRTARVPALAVAVHRADRPLWTAEIGGTDAPLDEGTQFRIGSVTKAFTAVLVLQCRDEGLLDLDDPISAHLPVPAHGSVTARQLLAHTSGLQREPAGDIWYGAAGGPGVPELLERLAAAERVLPPQRRYHYSNLGLAVLGQVVGRLRGATWADVLVERLLTPLGLGSTTVLPRPGAATGYLVDAYSDHARPEPAADFRAVGPACQLWSTAGDLARWAAFLADPATVDPEGKVLAATTLAEMRTPRAVVDEGDWRLAMGLGLMVAPRPGRVADIGHYGAMPGFMAGSFGRYGGDTPPGLGAAVLASSGTALPALDLVHDLLTASVELDPADAAPWRPGQPVPPAYRSALGRWWGEGHGFDFHWRAGHLEARAATAAADTPPAVFGPVDGAADTLRVVAGRELGELLTLARAGDGTVTGLTWAGYRFSRSQQTFDGQPPSHA
ncbi:serine hydrolase [Pilimelia anulata]|uniref:Serine hydrolase n=1 Tax=Pilimelia anulata TaxID=53371 RepID=A0A8J3AY98_9ACTN|nr:serine hydrolase domain-containing protein [Pilimelia anulata]GGJ74339.1 serine hydrolase [Pilimelia anulata]